MFGHELLSTLASRKAASPKSDLCDKQVLIRNLTFVWHTTKASEHLLKVAVGRASGVPLLYDYYLDHLEEERGHHRWLAEDLATEGVLVESQPVSRLAAEMVGAQYYYLFHGDAAALLGYMAALEGTPTPMAAVEALESIHGAEILKTVRYHAEHDIEHAADLCRVLDRVPERSRAIILENALETVDYLATAALTFETQNG